MNSIIWKKLNLKHQNRIVVLHSPASFEKEIDTLSDVQVYRNIRSAKSPSFLIAFVTKENEIENIAVTLGQLGQGDAIVWFCYPKRTSKNYTSDLDRDTDWKALGAVGFEGVRQVAIDEDWSAIRFRRIQYIKTMTRNPKRSLTALGKALLRKRKGRKE